MALDDEADDCFARGFAIMQRLPETGSWKARLEQVIETAMRMRRVTSAKIKEETNG